MVTRRPHTAVITWSSAGTKDANNVYTPGSEQTKTASCNVQPNNSGRMIVQNGGSLINYSFTVYFDYFGEAANIPVNAKIKFTSANIPLSYRNKNFIVLQITVGQRVVIKA